MITIHNLALVEIQLICQYLDLKSLLIVARCSKQLHNDANSKIAFKYLPQLDITNITKECTTSQLFHNHPQLYYSGAILKFNNDTLHALHKFITYITIYDCSILHENTNTITEIIKNNTALTSLAFKYTDITEDASIAIAEAIKSNCKITSLSLIGNTFTEIGFNAIKNNSIPAKLGLNWHNPLDINTLTIEVDITNNSTITNLDLGWNYINK